MKAKFFVMGCVIGSFLTVVIYRVPRGLPIWGRKSHRPECGHVLSFREQEQVHEQEQERGKLTRRALVLHAPHRSQSHLRRDCPPNETTA
jgi:Bacterial Peptidase A24 N-terminal domain